MWHTNRRKKDPLTDKKLALIRLEAAQKLTLAEIRIETVAAIGQYKPTGEMTEAEIDALIAWLRREEMTA